MQFQNEKDPGDPFQLWRVKKDFVLGQIHFQVGVARIWSSHEMTQFIQYIVREMKLGSYADGCNFFNEHIEIVKS